MFDSDFLWFLYVENPGTALGFRFLPVWGLAIISLIAVIGMSWYLFRTKELPVLAGYLLSVIIGGAIGNMIDRMFRKTVIDFVSVNMPDRLMDRFPVFNVADSAVSVGVTIILFFSLFYPRLIHPPETATPAMEPEEEAKTPAKEGNDFLE